MAVYMVGTPGNSVGFFFVMSCSTGSSSKRGRMMIEPPMATVKFITTVIANTWKNGSTPIMRSLPGSIWGFQRSAWWMLAWRFACVSIAPFGKPVVPPVYWNTAISSRGSISGGSWRPSLSSSRPNGTWSPSSGAFAISLRFNNGKSRFLGKDSTSCNWPTTSLRMRVRASSAAIFG